MRKLKQFGLNSEGLLLFYISSIRTVLCYASPAFYTILSKANFNKLDRIQRQATHIILPHVESYSERLQILSLSKLDDFMYRSCEQIFYKVLSNPQHPLYELLTFNKNRTSSRRPQLFTVERTFTTKRSDSFIQYFMRAFNHI
jgi:hypothetical protein